MGVAREILKTLNNERRLTPILMIRRLHSSKSSVHGAITTLKDIGVIENVQHGLYELTPAGTTVVTLLEPLWRR